MQHPLGIQLSLAVGRVVPLPAPPFIAEALESVQVTHTDEGPSAFQMVFHADRTRIFLPDFDLLLSTLLSATNRVILTVIINGVPRVLMDGFITQQELSHSREYGASTLTVTGEDVSVKMDLFQTSMEYPGMPDDLIVGMILLKYAMYGVIPEVLGIPLSPPYLPIQHVPQQYQTDRQYLNQLASFSGFVFFVRPGPFPGVNTAYWGPPQRFGLPQRALTVDMGPATNVEKISFQYNALAPMLVHGEVQDDELETIFPIETLFSTRLPPLALEPAILVNQGLLRNVQFEDPRLGAARGEILAQAMTDVSTDKVVVVQGELDALRYGDILMAPGLVGVRGAGFSYDGLYYVQSVTHQISRGAYRQQFVLTREGLGSLTPVVMP